VKSNVQPAAGVQPVAVLLAGGDGFRRVVRGVELTPVVAVASRLSGFTFAGTRVYEGISLGHRYRQRNRQRSRRHCGGRDAGTRSRPTTMDAATRRNMREPNRLDDTVLYS